MKTMVNMLRCVCLMCICTLLSPATPAKAFGLYQVFACAAYGGGTSPSSPLIEYNSGSINDMFGTTYEYASGPPPFGTSAPGSIYYFPSTTSTTNAVNSGSDAVTPTFDPFPSSGTGPESPIGNMVELTNGTDTYLYGVATAGGANGYGGIYDVDITTPSSSMTYTMVYSFQSSAYAPSGATYSDPVGGLTYDSTNQCLYGTFAGSYGSVYSGGASGASSIFQYDLSSNNTGLTIIGSYSNSGANGTQDYAVACPTVVSYGGSNYLVGTAVEGFTGSSAPAGLNHGLVWVIGLGASPLSASTSAPSSYSPFSGGSSDGDYPWGPVCYDSTTGDLYGLTTVGGPDYTSSPWGNSLGFGTVYSIPASSLSSSPTFTHSTPFCFPASVVSSQEYSQYGAYPTNGFALDPNNGYLYTTVSGIDGPGYGGSTRWQTIDFNPSSMSAPNANVASSFLAGCVETPTFSSTPSGASYPNGGLFGASSESSPNPGSAPGWVYEIQP